MEKFDDNPRWMVLMDPLTESSTNLCRKQLVSRNLQKLGLQSLAQKDAEHRPSNGTPAASIRGKNPIDRA